MVVKTEDEYANTAAHDIGVKTGEIIKVSTAGCFATTRCRYFRLSLLTQIISVIIVIVVVVVTAATARLALCVVCNRQKLV